jgi:hypothetical protein
MKTNKKNRSSYTKTILLIGIALIAIASVAAYALSKRSNDTAVTPQVSAKAAAPILKPATPEEKQAATQNKEQIVQAQKTANPATKSDTPTTTTNTASVVIVNADKAGVSGYVSGVFEDGGTCTATATSTSGTTTTKSSSGFQNASYTQCAPISWDKQLTAGSWSITLKYVSATSSGTTTKVVEVQ